MSVAILSPFSQNCTFKVLAIMNPITVQSAKCLYTRAKVLMLHGHGQSGQFFKAKARYLEQNLEQAILNSLDYDHDHHDGSGNAIEFYYPSGLLPANPDAPQGNPEDTWAWGHGDHTKDRINGLENSLEQILQLLETSGPFIGVVGFSTGAALAAIITSLLEKRVSLAGFKFNITHLPFKFAVCCSGFRLSHSSYASLYSQPLDTPTFHAIALMDTTVEPVESMQLAQACKNVSIYTFFGTHYVPRTNEFLNSLTVFIRGAISTENIVEEWENWDSENDEISSTSETLSFDSRSTQIGGSEWRWGTLKNFGTGVSGSRTTISKPGDSKQGT